MAQIDHSKKKNAEKRVLPPTDHEDLLRLASFNLLFVTMILRASKPTKSWVMAQPSLILRGYEGLLASTQFFGTHNGWKFSVYAAWWVKQAVVEVILDSGVPLSPRKIDEVIQILSPAPAVNFDEYQVGRLRALVQGKALVLCNKNVCPREEVFILLQSCCQEKVLRAVFCLRGHELRFEDACGNLGIERGDAEIIVKTALKKLESFLQFERW